MYDKFSLGEIIFEGSYSKYFYIKDKCNLFTITDFDINNLCILPEILIYIKGKDKDKDKDKYFLINKDIYES